MQSKSKLVNLTRQKDRLTEKGMMTNSTSLNACVDMFFLAGSTRHWGDNKIELLFQKALSENPLLALKILFWARDIRQGSGERNFFRVCLSYLQKNYLGYLQKNIDNVPIYGRWDDLFHLDKNLYLPLVSKGIDDKNSLLCKWLPRKGEVANNVRKHLKLTPKEYRKLIVSLSKTVEQDMCSKNFNNINYEHVPSVAMNKYRNSFYKNDNSRFTEYISNVKNMGLKINSKALYPYQLYDAFLRTNDEKITNAIESQWYSLPNYMEDSEQNILPMIDTSGSMSYYDALPERAGWSLGLYISERNKSIFKDAFLTFSTNPKMIYLNGTISERIRIIKRVEWKGTTNIEAAFDLLLNKAVDNKLNKSEMPNMILILSDMQFDRCVSNYNDTAFDMIKRKYNDSGYDVPKIVFWNLRSEMDNIAVSAYDENVNLISGFSPNILKSLLKGEKIENETPYDAMIKVINNGRYDSITI